MAVIKAAMVCLAMVPAVAGAWESPQQAIEAFVAWELGGGRLQTDNEGLARHVHVDPDYEGMGPDTVMLSDRHSIDAPRCTADSCQVTVRYHLPAADGQEDLPLGNGKRARTQRVSYTVVNRDGHWRVHSDSLTDLPYVSPAAVQAHQAGMQDEELQDEGLQEDQGS